MRGRDRPKAPPPPANGLKTAPSASRGRMTPQTRHTAPQHTPPQPTATASPLLEGQVFDDVSPDEMRQLRGERAAALAAEEELMIQVRICELWILLMWCGCGCVWRDMCL